MPSIVLRFDRVEPLLRMCHPLLYSQMIERRDLLCVWFTVYMRFPHLLQAEENGLFGILTSPRMWPSFLAWRFAYKAISWYSKRSESQLLHTRSPWSRAQQMIEAHNDKVRQSVRGQSQERR
jgi:hypothetical protein